MTDNHYEIDEDLGRYDYEVRSARIMVNGHASAAEVDLRFIAKQNKYMLDELDELSELSRIRDDLRKLCEEVRGLRHDVQFGFFLVLVIVVFLGYHLWRLYFAREVKNDRRPMALRATRAAPRRVAYPNRTTNYCASDFLPWQSPSTRRH